MVSSARDVKGVAAGDHLRYGCDDGGEVRIPERLQDGIDEVSATSERAAVLLASRELSERYQRGDCALALPTAAHRAAYLETRMPATFAASRRVFAEVRRMLPGLELASMLDLGAGPGTAMWAASEVFPSLRRFRLVERDCGFIEAGQRLAAHSENEAVRKAEWVQGNAASHVSIAGSEPFDMVVMSYALGEFTNPDPLIVTAWRATAKVLVIVEPGTPRHFQTILAARDWLIKTSNMAAPGSEAAQIAAPCPHHNICPLAAAGDWCHFAERLERTAEHRRMKGGTLGYEDEKFSYLVGSRVSTTWPRARVVRHPRFYPGHVKLALCTAEGLKEQAVGKSQKQNYRAARKTEWGDAWNIVIEES